MIEEDGRKLLSVNTGSSSVKAALYGADETLRLVLSARIDRIGLSKSRVRIVDGHDRTLLDRHLDLPDHRSAIDMFVRWLQKHGYAQQLLGVGHRVVHGGPRYAEPQLITPDLVAALERLVPIDPDHLPQALDAVQVAERSFPEVPQIACFDTAFHRHMPRVAQIYALPYRLTEIGVLRYGFHGLSYEYILDRLGALDEEAARGRIIVAHLGNGSSMAAVYEGKGIDTTMGFTPTGGLVMGTRSGDLDPGVLLYLLQVQRMEPAAVNALVNKESGLLGVSGVSGDMLDLLVASSHDARAAQAIDLYCYQARKFLGALAAALGGLDTLIFTAGIGERSPDIRGRICAGLTLLGIELDPEQNQYNAPVISSVDSRVTVRVMPTDEDLMIARHTWRLLKEGKEHHVSV